MIEDTLVLIKPDGVQRNIIGDVISRFERAGLRIVGLKMLKPSESLLENHYPLTPDWVAGLAAKTRESFAKKGIELKETDMQIAQRVQNWLKEALGSGMIVAIVVRGNCAVEIVRKLVGSTEPKMAAAGTIRGDFSTDSYDLADVEKRSVKNIVHASGTVDEAKREIEVWFQKKVVYY
ncbi:MAG: nucleoside-diphosphate kinase [archaeon]